MPIQLNLNSPVTAIILVGAGVALALLLLLISMTILLIKTRRLEKRLAKEEAERSKLRSEFELHSLDSRQTALDLQELRKRVNDPGEPVQTPAALWTSPDIPVNLNRRGQIMRLSRKGKSVAEIAQDLHVAQGEVELLLKVHDLSQRNPESENS